MIYIDDYQADFRGMKMSHMVSDTSLEELHEFAEKLGMKRAWFQNGSAPHYDVSEGKRQQAYKMGAQELPIRIDDKPNPKWQEVIAKARKLKE